MDPIIAGIGAKVADILLPLVKKGAQQFAKEVGVAACEKAESMLKALRVRLSGDKTATDMLSEFEKDPEGYRPVLEKIIQKKVDQDNDLATELIKLLKDMGPTLKVIQKMKEAEDVTGMEAEEMTEGSVEVVEEFEKAKKIIGVKIGRIGK